MRIDYERTGGFAGMRVATTVNTEALPPEEARGLREAVEAARFFELPALLPSPSPGADRFRYKLTVEVEGRQHTVEMSEDAVPEALRSLLQQLTTRARAARGS